MAHLSNKWPGMMACVQQTVFLRAKYLILLLLALYGLVTDWFTLLPLCSADHFLDSEGPHFISEPGRLNYFTNVQGLLLHCNVRGTPAPKVFWVFQKDNQPVDEIPGVRKFFSNGSLYFPPFQVSYYRPGVHDQVYVCVAENAVGKIKSRDVHIRAVINQQFDVTVESAYTSEGNDALLRCVVPDPVRDFVSVTSWVKDSTLNIFPPHSGGGGRYFMAPSGELLIENVNRNDSLSTFRCRTVNRLTDETQLSGNVAKLQLKESKGATAPRMLSRVSRVKLKEGDVGVVFCLSEGHPAPMQHFFRVSGPYGQLEIVRQSERVRVRKSAVIFESVSKQDMGTYVCVANNTSGSDRYNVQVEVGKPLEVQVVPGVVTVDIGKSAEFTCWSNRAFQSSGSSSNNNNGLSIAWKKDGIEIRPNLRQSLSENGEKLSIATVQREDRGIYQCFVKSDTDMAQAAAELRLGDSHPQLIYRFIEQTLRPGGAVSMKCSATGNPTPHISWMLDGFPLPHSERLLIGQYVTIQGDVVSHVNITQTRVEDGGYFQCLATNKLGSSSHAARLNIYGAPFVRPMPNTMTAVAGKIFHIKCPVAGYPISGISWEKDEQLLPSTIRQMVSPNGTLTIRDVDRVSDSGWYTCTASNKQGNSNRRGVHINVVVPPKLAPFSFPESPREGERILAMCGVSDGDPPIKLQWLKDQKPIQGNGKAAGNSSLRFSDMSTHQMSDFGVLALQIPHVTWNDTGNYSCVAHNKAGHAILTLPLVVHVPPRIAPYTFPSPVSQGSRVQLVCSVEQGDTEETNLTVAWLKDGETLRPASSSGLITASLPPLSSSYSPSPSATATNAKVVQVDAYSAILIIERVDAERDSGNYTCRITNSVDDVQKTNQLVVRVPPKWVREPTDFEVVEGKSLQIPCEAKGFPAPKASWKRAMSERPENFRDVPQMTSLPLPGSSEMAYNNHQDNGNNNMLGGMQMNSPVSYSNGSLVIQVVRKQDHGYYLCEATNGIGSGLSKVIRLTVHLPIRIKEPLENVSLPVGSIAKLQCEMSGDPPLISVGWRKAHDEIKPAHSRYRIRVLNNTAATRDSSGGSTTNGAGTASTIAGGPTSILSELTVTNVGREDSARYICFAANRHGESQQAVWLHVQEPPDVPRNLHVISKSSRFLRLGWVLTQGNTPPTQFLIKYKEEGAEGSEKQPEVVRVSGNVFSETVRELRPATQYIFTVTAENQVGQGKSSEPLFIQTDGEAPEGKARNVRVTAVGSSDIQVTWEHPEKASWHGRLLGYYVGYRKYRDGEQYQFSTVESKESENLQEFLVTGLSPYTPFEIVVQAYNGIGTGPMSEAMLVTTLEDVPSTYPDTIQCQPLTSDSLQITWNSVTGEQARGLITGYRVNLEQVDDLVYNSGGESYGPLQRNSQSTSLIFNGLAKYTNYSVQVEAFTGVGMGPPSPPVFCQTEQDVPSSPLGIKAIVSGSSSITVSWLPPLHSNGKLTKYNVYMGTVAVAETQSASNRIRDGVSGLRKRSVPADTNKFLFESLRPDVKYEFRVSANTRVGEGDFAAVQKTLQKSVVSAVISFGQEWRVVWKTDVLLACEIVGDSIIQWTKYTDLVRNSDRITINRDGSVLIREARREDSGNYTCTINANGHGVDSITHRVIVQVPPLAPLLTAAGTSFATVNLQWKLSDSGGAAIKGYVLHVKQRDEWIEKRVSRHLGSFELQGLECGTYYQMYLTAYNRAGMGAASEMVNVSTLGSAPSLKLTTTDYMAQSNRTVTKILLKDVWTGNGCGIRSFRVFYKGGDSPRWLSVGVGEVDGESHSIELQGLKPGSPYHIRVIAVNSAGSQQAEVSITTPSATQSNNGNNVNTETSTNVMNQLQSTPFYLDAKLMGPIFVAGITLVIVSVSACVCYKRKSSPDGQSNENLSVGTPSSSLYFKGNPNHTLRHPQYHSHHQAHHHHPHSQQQHPHPPTHLPPQLPQQQMYMTVKKSTPHKTGGGGGGVDRTDIETIPQYASDTYPYATFEVNEPPQRDLRACNNMVLAGVATLERNRHPSRRQSGGQESIKHLQSQQHHQHQHHHLPHNLKKEEESDDYDSYGSESDYQEEPAYHVPYQQQQPKFRSTSRSAAGFKVVHQESLDYGQQGRCENRYEFGPQQQQQQQGRNDEIIHGMVSSEPYAFNDSYPTALVQDKRGTGKKKNGRRKFHRGSLEAYVSSAEVIGSEKFQLEPPEGFTDTLGSKTQKSGESGGGTVGGGVASEGGSGGKAKQGGRVQMKAGNEYAIAV